MDQTTNQNDVVSLAGSIFISKKEERFGKPSAEEGRVHKLLKMSNFMVVLAVKTQSLESTTVVIKTLLNMFVLETYYMYQCYKKSLGKKLYNGCKSDCQNTIIFIYFSYNSNNFFIHP